jgi:phage terminase large subunit-like protein
LKLDDCVNDENSRTVTRIESTNKSISIMEALLNPNGFKNVLGTWYDNADYYGLKIQQEETVAKEEGLETVTGSVDSGRFNSHSYIKVYLRACWWLTEEAEQLGKIEEEITKKDLILWFPERLTYEYLNKKKKLDPYFYVKYINNPRKHHQVKFPRELLIRRTIPHNQLPQQGIVVSTVDTAYSVQNWADYTVMITALIYGGRFYIINMIRGRFNEFELPQVIAAGAFKWKPKRIAIEDSVGVKWMGRELRREMDKLRISVPVEFVSLGYGSKANSKKMKAKPVARLLGDERMFFLNSCEGLQDIYTELEKFSGTADDTHDDIVSALSLLAEVFQPYADMESKINFTSTQFVADRQSEERYNQIYCLGKYTKIKDNYVGDNPSTLWEMEQAFKQNVSSTDNYGNPLEDVLS